MQLYTYFRSSAAYRVRIALALKRLAFEPVFVHLKRGEQRAPAYLGLNPQGLLPLLRDGSFTLGQSLAIIEYLEERHPDPPLLPGGFEARARVRSLAYAVCCDIHPLQNLRVQRFLRDRMGQDDAAVLGWLRHFIEEGLAALEVLVARDPERGEYCHGLEPTLADVCLVPQLYNAARYGCDHARFPTLTAIGEACNRLSAFASAAPERQPDAEPAA